MEKEEDTRQPEENNGRLQFLVMADAHVKDRTWVNYPQLNGDAYAALSELLKQSAGCETLVVAGDWFDSNRPSSSDVLASNGFMEKFKNILFIRGNHDGALPAWVSAIASGQSWELSDEPLECSGASWIGASWSLGRKAMLEKLDRLAGSVKAFRDAHGDAPLFIVLHASFRHLLGFGNWQLEIADLEDRGLGGEHFIVGDIHVPNLTTLSGGGWVLSPGALYPQSIDQLQHGYNACLVSGDYRVEWLHPEVRKYAVGKCADTVDVERLLAEASDPGLPLKPYVRAVCDGAATLDQSRLDALRDRGIVHVVGKGDDGVQAAAPDAGGTVQGASLEAAVEAELQDDDLKQMAGALLSSDDPLAEIEKWLTFWKIPRI